MKLRPVVLSALLLSGCATADFTPYFAEALGYGNKRDAKATKANRNVSPPEKIASSKRRLISAFRTWLVEDWKEVKRSLLFWVQLCSGTIAESEKSESAKQFTLQDALSERVECFW
jgi:hypothetical protein